MYLKVIGTSSCSIVWLTSRRHEPAGKKELNSVYLFTFREMEPIHESRIAAACAAAAAEAFFKADFLALILHYDR